MVDREQNLSFNLKLLRISSLTRTLTIEGIRFQLNEGERAIAILGESGLGKTTIFKTLFPQFVSGWSLARRFEFKCDHSISGTKITEETILANRLPFYIGFATQVPYFENSRSVEENIFAPLSWKKKHMTAKAKSEFLQIFDLVALAKENMHLLSGGQRQLVNIARMLVLNPQLAVIDECFSNMDEEMAEKYINILKADFSTCIFLLTSHRKADVDAFGCRSLKLMKRQYVSGDNFVTLVS